MTLGATVQSLKVPDRGGKSADIVLGYSDAQHYLVRPQYFGATGRVMEILTTAPAVQFYSGNFLDGTVTGKSGQVYRQGDALVFEPQLFPDAPNHPNFSSARLDPGGT
jgi:galactose mutarotase-like enzyme